MLGHRFHPLIPVSGTGTGLSPLPSRERGCMVGLYLLSPRPVDSRLRGNDGGGRGNDGME